MARIPVDPNYSFPTFPRATAATDIFVKEDVQALAAAVSTHVHDGAGKGLLVGGPAAGSITNAMLGADVARDNLLVNGGFEIWQRGNGPFSAQSAFTADRWQIQLGGTSTLSVQKAASPATGGGGFALNGTYVHNALSLIVQRLGDSPFHLQGRQVTLSMWVTSNVANSVRLVLYDGTGSAQSAYATAGYSQLSVTFTVGASATWLEVRVSLEASCTFYVDNAMLVVGSQAANYVPMHPADDLARCKRYYKVPFLTAGDATWNGYGPAGASLQWTFPMDIEMAVAPTITKNGTPWFVSNCGQPTFSGSAKVLSFTVVVTAIGLCIFQNSGGSGQTLTMEANP